MFARTGKGLNVKQISVDIVPAGAVMPHEIADPGREHRIEARVRADGMLRDPLIVGAVPGLDGYVLLDGTNRLRALHNLGFPWVMAQILDYSDQHTIRLRTWCHAASVPIEELIAGAGAISGIEVEPLAPLGAPEALAETATLAVLLDHGQRFALRRGTEAPPRSQQLRRLVDLYELHMVRVDCDPEDIEERAKQLSGNEDPMTLLAFPPFSRSQVVSMAMDGALIPAGITRHMLPAGRALRVNVPLEILGANTLETARIAFAEHLSTLQPRMYREPTMLFDS